MDADGTPLFKCVECKKYFYRQIDNPGQDRADDATIDHVEQFEKYIREHAEPDDEGNITSSSAQEASNDLDNLEIRCRSCNAIKNGERNVFD